MSTLHRSTERPQARAAAARRRWGFLGLALAWYVVNTFTPLGLPNVAVVLVLGLLVMLSVEPDSRCPERGVAAVGRNVVLLVLAVFAFTAVVAGRDLLLGRMPIESIHAVLGTSAAIVVMLPRLAETRELPGPAVLGHRELVISVTALVAVTRMYQASEVFVAALAFPVLAAVVMAVRRLRLGAWPPRRLTQRAWALQAGNFWLLLALLGAAGLTGMFYIVRVYTPDAQALLVGAFWVGLAAMAVLVAFPRRRVSVATNTLAALGSVVLVIQLVGVSLAPRDAVRIGLPFTEEWQVVSGGRSALINNHWPLDVQRHAIDFLQLVDGKTYHGDRSRLENFHIFGDPLLAVADGQVTAALDSRPDLPIGVVTWHEMEGNYVILDIGGGRYVLYGHLKQDSLQVRVGDRVRRGQVLGLVGDSGNTGEPHLHIQVQNTPTFDVENPAIRTYPIVFEGATVADVRRGDSVRPVPG